jgi:hypothetical protein
MSVRSPSRLLVMVVPSRGFLGSDLTLRGIAAGS